MLFQITLVVTLTDAQSDDLYSLCAAKNIDVYYSITNNLEEVKLIGSSASSQLPLAKLVKMVERVGGKVVRVQQDLVNAVEIAERVGVNRETVRLWREGKRKADFPLHYCNVGVSLIWNWPDVLDWLRSNNQQIDDFYNYEPLCPEVNLVAA